MEALGATVICFWFRYWRHELERKSRGLKPRLWMTIVKCYWWRVILQGMLSLLEVLMAVGQSLLLGYTTRYFSLPCEQRTSEETRNAYLFAAGWTVWDGLGYV